MRFELTIGFRLQFRKLMPSSTRLRGHSLEPRLTRLIYSLPALARYCQGSSDFAEAELVNAVVNANPFVVRVDSGVFTTVPDCGLKERICPCTRDTGTRQTR